MHCVISYSYITSISRISLLLHKTRGRSLRSSVNNNDISDSTNDLGKNFGNMLYDIHYTSPAIKINKHFVKD